MWMTLLIVGEAVIGVLIIWVICDVFSAWLFPKRKHRGQTNEIPRRYRLDRSTPAELAIRAAVNAVEALPAHRLLAEAVVLLDQALHKVADFVDLPSQTTKDE